ncbi:MAG: hypothetical protein JWO08_4549 [Verrucomicrobiaceae bacterium]|nr:hypothetical protein [Verrucomicrobiaceae bacterium]
MLTMVFFKRSKYQGHECEPLIIVCRSCGIKVKKLSNPIGISALNLPVLHVGINHKTKAIAQPIYRRSRNVPHVLPERLDQRRRAQDSADTTDSLRAVRCIDLLASVFACDVVGVNPLSCIHYPNHDDRQYSNQETIEHR